MGAQSKTVASVGNAAKSVGGSVTSARRAGARPARDMIFVGLKGAAIALRGTGYICGKCADGLELTAAMARGASGAVSPAVAVPAVEDPGETALDNAATAPVDLNTATLSELCRITFIDEARARIREQVGTATVILGLAGGVVSSVAAALR